MGLFVAGLWPFNFRAENHTDLATDGKGLRFEAPVKRSLRNLGGMVFTPRPLSCRPKAVCVAGELTIVIELTAANATSSCLKRIVVFHRPNGSEAIFIGQWRSLLILRWFQSASVEDKPYGEIGLEGVLAAGRTAVVTIVSAPSETAIYIDGQPTDSYPGLRLLRENETLEAHKIYFGNSPDLDCPWAGSVRAFAIYGKAWTSSEVLQPQGPRAGGRWPCEDLPEAAAACYRFDRLEGEFIADVSGSGNDLWKPGFLVFEKRPLGLPNIQSISFFDLTVNLLGFLPFGFLVQLRLLMSGRLAAKNHSILTVAVGFAVSLAIELTQVWLPGRDSSALDLIANAGGTAIGAFLAIKYDSSRLRRRYSI